MSKRLDSPVAFSGPCGCIVPRSCCHGGCGQLLALDSTGWSSLAPIFAERRAQVVVLEPKPVENPWNSRGACGVREKSPDGGQTAGLASWVSTPPKQLSDNDGRVESFITDHHKRHETRQATAGRRLYIGIRIPERPRSFATRVPTRMSFLGSRNDSHRDIFQRTWSSQH